MRVRDLTNNDPWGASPTELRELCQSLDKCDGDDDIEEGRNEILVILRQRWSSEDSTWRNIYKSLQMYEYFLLHSSKEYLSWLQRDGGGELDIKELNRLTEFEYVDSSGKDQAINVRTRAEIILKLLRDPMELEGARKDAALNRKTMMMRKKEATSINTTSSAPPVKSNKGTSMSRTSTPSMERLSHSSADMDDEKNDYYSPVSSKDITNFHNEIEIEDEFDDFQSAITSPVNNVNVKSEGTIQNLVDL